MLIGRLSVRGWSTTILRMVLICSLNPAAPKMAASLTPRNKGKVIENRKQAMSKKSSFFLFRRSLGEAQF